MAYHHTHRRTPRINRDFIDFIETAQYNPPAGSHPAARASLPRAWREYQHPIGDVYYHHHGLRLITAENVRDPATLAAVLAAREAHLQAVAGDANAARLPPDSELVVADLGEGATATRLCSRAGGAVYHWAEDTGLRVGKREEFWSHVAEFPAHHSELPPHAEEDFVESVCNAKDAIGKGTPFCFTEGQVDKIIARYQDLVALRKQGRNVVPSLAWLIGVVLPLDPLHRAVGGYNVDHILHGGCR